MLPGEEPTRKAQDLKAGQRVYISRLGRWFTLAKDAKTHRLSRNLIRLEFAEIPAEYRRLNEDVRVRSPRRKVGADAGREL